MRSETRPRSSRLRRRLLSGAAVLLLLAALVGLAGVVALRSSLPRLDGVVVAQGLHAAVSVERDALGAVILRGGSRDDLAFATGFVHAQERFFQMDLMRRRAAGELAALLGEVAVSADRQARIHGFRRLARRVVAEASPRERSLLAAYTRGVGAGLADLGARPFEYLLLRRQPAPWREEDTVLVLASMFQLLQDEGRREAALATMAQTLPGSLFAFLAASGTRWDAALDGTRVAEPPLPDPATIDLRKVEPTAAPAESGLAASPVAGSNNWAVAASRTVSGDALLANDMHLPLGVPNIWFRMRLVLEGEAPDAPRLDVAGLGLPGTPVMVVGSNRQVAWGFTNAQVDTSDLVVLDLPADGKEDRYLAPGGWRPFEVVRERIEVAGGDGVDFEYRRTIWGPVVGRDPRGRPWALRWVAHEPEALNLALLGLEQAHDVRQAIAVAHRTGIPAQNFLVVDRAGSIAWTLIGRLPRRRGFDGLLPGRWCDGSRSWEGWIDPAEVPTIIDPADGVLWTANNRTVGGEALARLGDGGYDLGARARQIRDDLQAVERHDERSLLAIQLDDRGLLLEPWRRLMLETVKAAGVGGERGARLADLLGAGPLRAQPASVAYRLVRGFRLLVIERVLGPLLAPCREADPRLGAGYLRQVEGPVWRLLTLRPPHLLGADYDTWDALLEQALDDLLDQVDDRGGLAAFTWGRRNVVRVRHPFSRSLPWLARWLDLPPAALPGDTHMPRVQGPGMGASERMVVSPGHEERGLLHMPGGQSGHFLSPFYGAGQQAWERGEPTPFLPGPVEYRLRLEPAP
ncbi:MAG: penicillin acylase family protein [Acidobacteriota bacterium]|nr:penicillin acylase family protein [Acidobacteriota bacterium]